MKTTLIAIFYAQLCIYHSFSQQPTIKPLSIGDTVPDTELQMVNYKAKKAHLYDFKSKLLILDFWSTWCASCIEQFPKMQDLQKEFGHDLMILPVTFYKNREYNEKFFQERKKNREEIKLPSVVEDKMLIKQFPTYGLPHEVWIDSNGIVIAITDAQPVTEKVIRKILSGEKINLPRQVYDKNFTMDKPLLVDANGGPDSAFYYRSIITGYNPIAQSIGVWHATYNGTTRIAVTDRPILEMYKIAVSRGFEDYLGNQNDYDYLNKRVIIETDSPKRFLDFDKIRGYDYLEMEDYKESHLFCYEIWLPPNFSIDDSYKMMALDLQHFFRFHGSIQKRKIKCLELVRTSTKNNVTYSGDTLILAIDDSLHCRITGYPIYQLVLFLNNSFHIPYVIDRTGFSGAIDVNISLPQPATLKEIRSVLRRYGLDLIETEKEIDMIVINDKDYRMDKVYGN